MSNAAFGNQVHVVQFYALNGLKSSPKKQARNLPLHFFGLACFPPEKKLPNNDTMASGMIVLGRLQDIDQAKRERTIE